MKSVDVDYYASFRDLAGKKRESLDTHSQTPKDLYEELSKKYSFELSSKHVKIAVNDEFVELDYLLSAGDKIVFIPPVAGG